MASHFKCEMTSFESICEKEQWMLADVETN